MQDLILQQPAYWAAATGLAVYLAGHFIRERGHEATRLHPRWSGEARLGLIVVLAGRSIEIAGGVIMVVALFI
jgi:hypothetical protein